MFTSIRSTHPSWWLFWGIPGDRHTDGAVDNSAPLGQSLGLGGLRPPSSQSSLTTILALKINSSFQGFLCLKGRVLVIRRWSRRTQEADLQCTRDHFTVFKRLSRYGGIFTVLKRLSTITPDVILLKKPSHSREVIYRPPDVKVPYSRGMSQPCDGLNICIISNPLWLYRRKSCITWRRSLDGFQLWYYSEPSKKMGENM